MTRLVLWDVDGTLVHGGEAASAAFEAAVERVLGRPAGEHRVRMSGKTDPEIALEILAAAQVAEGDAHTHLPLVLEHLELELAAAVHELQARGHVKPGVVDLLPRLHEALDITSSVLTGNIEPNGRLKVAAFGLDRWLDLDVGAYGSDDHDRNKLVAVARSKLRSARGMPSSPATCGSSATPHATLSAHGPAVPGASSSAPGASRPMSCARFGPTRSWTISATSMAPTSC